VVAVVRQCCGCSGEAVLELGQYLKKLSVKRLLPGTILAVKTFHVTHKNIFHLARVLMTADY
jgi:hypothetical protein